MENILTLATQKTLNEELKNFCSEIKLDTYLISNKNFSTIFTIKIINKFSRTLSISLVQKIINIKEESFHSIIMNKSNGIINVSFLATKGEENKFLNNLLNFIKIIKLNKLFTTETNTLEQTVPIKMFQTFNFLNEQQIPNLSISFILSSNQIQIYDKLFSLYDGISIMNDIQNNPNYTTKFFNLNTNGTDPNIKLFNFKNFCKTVPVSFSVISNTANIFSLNTNKN